MSATIKRYIKDIHTKDQRSLRRDLQVHVCAPDEGSEEIRKERSLSSVRSGGISSGNETKDPRSSAERSFDPSFDRPRSVLRFQGRPWKCFTISRRSLNVGTKNWRRHPGKNPKWSLGGAGANINHRKSFNNRTTLLVPVPMLVTSCFYLVRRRSQTLPESSNADLPLPERSGVSRRFAESSSSLMAAKWSRRCSRFKVFLV